MIRPAPPGADSEPGAYPRPATTARPGRVSSSALATRAGKHRRPGRGLHGFHVIRCERRGHRAPTFQIESPGAPYRCRQRTGAHTGSPPPLEHHPGHAERASQGRGRSYKAVTPTHSMTEQSSGIPRRTPPNGVRRGVPPSRCSMRWVGNGGGAYEDVLDVGTLRQRSCCHPKRDPHGPDPGPGLEMMERAESSSHAGPGGKAETERW